MGMSKDAHTLDPASLPDDPALLKRMIFVRDILLAERDTQLAGRDAQLAARDVLLAEREALIRRVREEAAAQLEAERVRLEAEKRAEIAAILRKYYRPSSERFDPSQLLLFGRLVQATPIDEASVAQEAGEAAGHAADAEVGRKKKPPKRHNHGRRLLPDHLPRIEIEHDLSEAEKKCPCCGEPRCRIGREVSEQLEYIPASFKVLKHVRHQYACPRCEREAVSPQIVAAPKPPQPIDKGLPGPALLAYLTTSKLGDHLPLYRLEKIFARQGIEIARSTMCGWLAAVGELVRPLVDLMARRILLSLAIHSDDTTVPVQAPGEGKCRTGRLWVYLGDRRHPYIVYDYRPDRKRDGPAGWLRDYRGYLQADAYGGYDGIYSGGRVTEVACWAHARRKFFDALDDAARLALRQERSVPLLDSIKRWLDAESQVVLPRSMMAAAMGYALNQWDALRVYTTQGFLAIDNNPAERALRRVAIGRKNWLFAGNDYAGGTAARLYSLIASAERSGVEPLAYLTSLLADLPTTPADELDQLLPDIWAQRQTTPS